MKKWTGLKQGEFTGPMFGDSVINETSLLGDDLAYMGILDEGGQLSRPDCHLNGRSW